MMADGKLWESSKQEGAAPAGPDGYYAGTVVRDQGWSQGDLRVGGAEDGVK